MTELRLPETGLVLLIGVSGSGKSYFAARHFRPSQVVSSDHCRLVVSDDENDQGATGDAFDPMACAAGSPASRPQTFSTPIRSGVRCLPSSR